MEDFISNLLMYILAFVVMALFIITAIWIFIGIGYLIVNGFDLFINAKL